MRARRFPGVAPWLLAALAAAAGPAARADDGAGIGVSRPGQATRDNQFDGRLDLTQTMGVDDQTTRRLLFSDLRATLDGTRLFGADLGGHLDLRGRKGWDDHTEDRLTLREGYVQLNEDGGPWRLAVGRQLIRPAASAEVDGLKIERRLDARTSAFVFGGLVPDPMTEDFTYHFSGAGAGYEFRGAASNHGGGLVAQIFDGSVDRLYLTQQSYVRLTRDLAAAGFALVDFLQRDGLVAIEGDRHLDLTSAYGLLRYRALAWLDTSLSVNHNHTILPGRWWYDWLNQRQRAIGFVLDGLDPVGTRLSSLRGTANFEVTRQIVPYLQLRGDWRHTPTEAQGFETRGGLKLRPAWGFADLSYAYRDHFGTQSHLGALRLGADRVYWGGETGLMALRSRPDSGDPARLAYDVDAVVWVALPRLLGTRQRVHLLLEYQAFIEPDITVHLGLVQLGYRL
jgi:hypothetical protein